MLPAELIGGANLHGEKYLSWPPNGASVYSIDDIGHVDEMLLNSEKTETLVAAKVGGVHEMETY